MTQGRVPAKMLRPRERCYWEGYYAEIERQARRTTFLRLLAPPFDGVRVQIKREAFLRAAAPAGGDDK